MKKVVVLGTSHGIQRGHSKEKENYKCYIEVLVNHHCIKAIAEEINDDIFSIAKEVAKNNNVAYKIIEPNPNEYDALNIEHIHIITYCFMSKYDLEEEPNKLNLSKKVYEEYESRIQCTYRAREDEWLKRLQKLDKWPVLVICGADHFLPFCNLLIENNINVAKENPYWGSSLECKKKW